MGLGQPGPVRASRGPLFTPDGEKGGVGGVRPDSANDIPAGEQNRKNAERFPAWQPRWTDPVTV